MHTEGGMQAAARPSKKARGTAASGLTAFALRLAKHLADDADEGADGVGQKNLVFSPLSIYAALALLSAGACGNTLDEVLAVLGAASRDEIAEFVGAVVEHALADHSESGAPLVAFACALWHEKTLALKPAYRAAAVESYKAETHAADFFNKPEKRKKINRWVSKATKNLITSILPQGSVRLDTALVLTNAIYFKGSWSMPFAKRNTETKSSQRLDGSYASTPFMHSWKEDHAVAEYDGFKVLKLPYEQTRRDDRHRGGRNTKRQDGQSSDEHPQFSMCIFLPDAHDGLPSLMDMMASRPNFLWDHMPSERVEVGELQLPKFKLSFSSRINGVLEDMGIKDAFIKGIADLSDMLEVDDGLVLEHVFHKAVIDVNEEGTEAAASTACVFTLFCDSISMSPPVNFIADHPFAFFVVEEVSSVVVFMGHVLDPTKPDRA